MPTIRKRGQSWQAQVRIKREGVVVFQTSASFATEREAKRWGIALEDRIAKEGVDVHYTQTVSVGKLVGAWLDYKTKTKKSPVSRGIQHSVSAILKSPFADKPVGQLQAIDLSTWATELQGKLNPSTIMHHLMVLRSAFVNSDAIVGFKANLAPIESAMATLKRSRVIAKSASREQRVTDDDLQRIITVFKGKSNQVIPMWDYVLLAVALPRRREELLTMRWSDYDGKIVVLRDTKHPTEARVEYVPVPPLAKEIIDRQPRFEGEERILPYKPESVSAAFQRAVRSVNLAHIRLHDLRHEGISRLFEQGLGIPEVSLISGHTSWAALRRYTNLRPLDVLEKLNAGIKATQKATTEPKRT